MSDFFRKLDEYMMQNPSWANEVFIVSLSALITVYILGFEVYRHILPREFLDYARFSDGRLGGRRLLAWCFISLSIVTILSAMAVASSWVSLWKSTNFQFWPTTVRMVDGQCTIVNHRFRVKSSIQAAKHVNSKAHLIYKSDVAIRRFRILRPERVDLLFGSLERGQEACRAD